MPYFLNGQQLEPGQGFSYKNINYPGNWLELATEKEKQNIGITFIETPIFDDRFYYLGDNGTVMPRNVDDIRDFWIGLLKKTAQANLSATDWMVIRQVDNGIPVPDDVKAYRETIRQTCKKKVADLATINSAEQLATYITGTDYPAWPLYADFVLVDTTGDPVSDGLESDGN